MDKENKMGKWAQFNFINDKSQSNMGDNKKQLYCRHYVRTGCGAISDLLDKFELKLY